MFCRKKFSKTDLQVSILGFGDLATGWHAIYVEIAFFEIKSEFLSMNIDL